MILILLEIGNRWCSTSGSTKSEVLIPIWGRMDRWCSTSETFERELFILMLVIRIVNGICKVEQRIAKSPVVPALSNTRSAFRHCCRYWKGHGAFALDSPDSAHFSSLLIVNFSSHRQLLFSSFFSFCHEQHPRTKCLRHRTSLVTMNLGLYLSIFLAALDSIIDQ